ncbi:hypothetical protein HYR99_02275 [Candidatus Poribacteria bacterium]|nr:hypothetical protein [Candidatus Poribacteria bacterium]
MMGGGNKAVAEEIRPILCFARIEDLSSCPSPPTHTHPAEGTERGNNFLFPPLPPC